MTDASSLDLAKLKVGDILFLKGGSIDVTLHVMRPGRHPTCTVFDNEIGAPGGVCQILGTIRWDPSDEDPLDIFSDGILLMESGPIARAIFAEANMADFLLSPDEFQVVRDGVVVMTG